MKTLISVCGVFHAPYLAAELHKRRRLLSVYTAHPSFFRQPQDLPRSRLRPVMRPLVRSPQFERISRGLITANPDRTRLDQFDAAVASKIKRRRPDLVVAWSGSGRQSLAAAKEVGIPTVLERGSFHIAAQLEILCKEFDRLGTDAGHLPDPATVTSELEEYTLADVIIVPSEAARSSFLERDTPPEKLVVVPLGSDVRMFGNNLAPTNPDESDRFVVMHAGGATAQKGVHLLLKAFNETSLPNSELRIFGSPSDEILPVLERYGRGVTHIGPVRRERLGQEMAAASVLVLASVHDGFGMVVCEAMAAGLPVICSKNAGASELIDHGKNGLIFDPQRPGDLAECLRWMQRDQELRRDIGRNGAKTAMGNTWAVYGDRVVASHEYARSVATASK